MSEITDTSDVSLTMEMYSLARDGNATRSAWGITTRRNPVPGLSPSADDASVCPLLTPRMPARRR